MIQKKICMVGAFGVGKTSLVARFVYTKFSEKYQTTVGVKIDKKVVQHPAGDIALILWDLAGEDALTTVRPAHLKGSSGYILVLDGLRRNTLDVAIDLQGRVSEAVGTVPFVCVVNKADLRESWEIQQSDLDTLVSRGWTVVETSAKTGAAVEGVFRTLTDAMMQEHHVDNSTAGAVAG
ncbi:MAG TPA: Rab family GTPase [Terriglobales bacterium]|nr:Rab family GTPase [Terriglobales bacterium]